MTPIAAILIITLANDGYWLAEQPAAIEIKWVIPHASPDAALMWEFGFPTLRLAEGKVRIGRGGANITIDPPHVRVPTEFRWQYRVVRKNDNRTLTAGEKTVRVYPPNQLDGLAERLADRNVMVCDRSGRLLAVLNEAGIKHDAIETPSSLALSSPDIILVAPDSLFGALFEQTPLINHARAGASVLIFAQARLSNLAGYQLQRRVPAPRMNWRLSHPLLVDLSPEALDSRAKRAATKTRALRLPIDEPALEIGHWPRESVSQEPSPIDAFIVTKTIGAGRVVLCQAPLDRWQDDPRSRIFLRNVLNYFLTRPEPTPRPSQRPAGDVVAPIAPEIRIPSGVTP